MPLFHLLYLFKQTQNEHQNKEEEKKEKKGQNKKKRKMGLLGSEHLENIVEAIKDKVKKVKKMKKRKKKTCYAKMDKSSHFLVLIYFVFNISHLPKCIFVYILLLLFPLVVPLVFQ